MNKSWEKHIDAYLGYEGVIYRWGSKAFDLMMLSVLWLLGSIPLITIGASSAALYYAVDKTVLGDEMTAFAAFAKGYKSSLKNGTGHWILSAAAGFVFLTNFGICRANMTGRVRDIICAAYILVLVLLLMNCCYIFPMIAHYSMPFGWYLRGSLYCVFRYLPISCVLLTLLMCGYYSVLKFPLMIIMVPGMYTGITVSMVSKRICKFEIKESEL